MIFTSASIVKRIIPLTYLLVKVYKGVILSCSYNNLGARRSYLAQMISNPLHLRTASYCQLLGAQARHVPEYSAGTV